MSFKNLLDLRKRVNPQVTIVERIILQKKSLKKDFFLAFSVIIVASTIIWNITKADSVLVLKNENDVIDQNFSASGIVSSITNLFGTYISIEESSESDNSIKASYVFNTNKVVKIESADYVPLSISDINVGDKIIVQGLLKDGATIEIYRIISFAVATSTKEPNVIALTDEEIASTTASTTSESATSSSAELESTSNSYSIPTDENTSTSTSTSTSASSTSTYFPLDLEPKDVNETSTEPQTLLDTITDVVQKVVGVVAVDEEAGVTPFLFKAQNLESTPNIVPSILEDNSTRIP